jgi:hypothetical protein
MLRGSLFFVSLVNVTGQRRDKQRRQNAKNDQHNNELYQRKAFAVLEVTNFFEHKNFLHTLFREGIPLPITYTLFYSIFFQSILRSCARNARILSLFVDFVL